MSIWRKWLSNFKCTLFQENFLFLAVENDSNDTNNNSSNHNNNVSGSNSSHNTSEVIKTEGESQSDYFIRDEISSSAQLRQSKISQKNINLLGIV